MATINPCMRHLLLQTEPSDGGGRPEVGGVLAPRQHPQLHQAERRAHRHIEYKLVLVEVVTTCCK